MIAALSVIRQCLDHPASGDTAMRAFIDHARQFGLEQLEIADLGPHLCQPFPCDQIGVATGTRGIILKPKQGADRVDIESELP